jgi:hypothetical protein
MPLTWNGISMMIDNAASKVREAQKAKRTSIFIVAGIIGLGIILFLRKK